MRAGVVMAMLALTACSTGGGAAHGGAGGAGTGGAGFGTDDVTTAKCLACHAGVAAAWAHGSSHRALLDCNGCHQLGVTFPHEKPGKALGCDKCHSEKSHPAEGGCVACHEPHGSSNLFLIREAVITPSGKTAYLEFTKLTGAAAGGLVGQGAMGVKPGTGLCEVCHTKTKVYDSAADGAPHDPSWCGSCHDHQEGFASPKVP